jgi:hypothetical protein
MDVIVGSEKTDALCGDEAEETLTAYLLVGPGPQPSVKQCEKPLWER